MSGEASQLRFAVLHHTGVPRPHYDLLIETAPDALLLTFCSDHWPLRNGDMVTRQPDHRRIYLDYEGPISGDRGEVKRIAAGPCRVPTQAVDQISAQLGDQIIELRTDDGMSWRVTVQ